MVVFFVMALASVGRLFYLQIIKGDSFKDAARDQHKIEQVLLQRRGEIFMHDMRSSELVPLVINKKLSLVYGVPSEIKNPKMAAKALADILKDDNGQCNELLPAKSGLVEKCLEQIGRAHV